MDGKIALEEHLEASQWRRWGVVSILMGAMFISLVDRFALAVLLEPVRKDLMLTDAQLELLGGISFGLFYVVASPSAELLKASAASLLRLFAPASSSTA